MRSIRLQALALSLASLAGLTILAAAPADAALDRWTHLGPFGGTVGEIVVAPSAPRTLYAIAENGVHRSGNAGASWVPVRAGLPQTFESPVSALAVDPGDERIVYAGIGRLNFTEGPSIYKTVNGRNWTPLSLTGKEITDLAVDPHDPARILASSSQELFRSEDAGATWERLSIETPGTISPLFEQVLFDPVRPDVAYAASSNFGVYKSVDGGDTWAAKNQGLPAARHLAVSPSGILYAVPDLPFSVYRSVDAAETWQLLGSLATETIQALGFSGDEETLIAGTSEGLFRKNETGPGWTRLRPQQREDIVALAFDPQNRDTLYAGVGFYGGFRGVLKSVDGGATWRSANRGLGGIAVNAVAIAPSDPNVIYAGLELWVVARSGDGGATWRQINPSPEARVYELAVDPRNANVVYAAGEYGVFWRSINGGRTWISDPIEGGSCIMPTSLVVDPRRPNRLLISGFKAIGCERGGEDSCRNLQSLDRGQTWTCLEGASDDYFFDIVPDPLDASTIYGGGTEGVLKTTDSGQTWVPVNNGILGGVAGLDITRNGKVLWASGRSIYKSRNGGISWRQSARGIPTGAFVGEVLLAPSDASVLYAVADNYEPRTDERQHHLYVSTNSGASWRRLTERGLPVPWYFGLSPFYLDLLVDPRDPGQVYVGTPVGLHRLDEADR